MLSSFRIALLSIIIWALALSHVHAQNANVILLFGDSLIAGYGLPAAEAVPAKLEMFLQHKHPAVTVINGGVSGDTTGAGRSRLEWTLQRKRPDLVLVALGGNDMLRGIPHNITQDNLAAMLEILQREKLPTILSAVRAPDSYGKIYQDKLDAVYKALAATYNVPLYPFLLADIFGNSAMMQADGIHPNAQGAERIAQQLADYILAAGYITAP